MTVTDQTAAIQEAIRVIVPDADLSTLDREASLRDVFELDSLDFLTFVERLSEVTGREIGESDYPALRSLGSCVAFLRRPGS